MTSETPTSTSLRYSELEHKAGTIAIVSLRRPEAANAFNGAMVTELTKHFVDIEGRSDVRLMILRGVGRNFCAGADLNWMKEFATFGYEENVAEAKVLTKMYETLHGLSMPTIAAVQGAAYGGAVGLAAACDVVIATNDARFCLSEVRVGLMPAVIVPYVARKIPEGALRRYALSGHVFNAREAMECGLVQSVCDNHELQNAVRVEVNSLLHGSPDAQKKIKRLIQSLSEKGFQQDKLTAEAIAEIRSSKSGQAGLKAFLGKHRAPWLSEVSGSWSLDD